MTDNRMTLTVEEAAEILGISRAFAYSLVKNDQLPSLRLGRRLVVPRRALERLIDGHHQENPGHGAQTGGGADE